MTGTATPRTGVALIGTGFMAKTHADAYRHIATVTVTHVVDVQLAPARELASTFGAVASTDLLDALRSPDVDVVDISVPTLAHASIAEAAFAAGKHVIVEKPIALDLAAADRMIAAANDADRFLMVAHVVRFWPAYEHIGEVLHGGSLGTPLHARVFRLSSPPRWAPWLLDPTQTGGAAIDLVIHDIDILNSYFGEPSVLGGWGGRGSRGRLTHVCARLDYEGFTAMVEASMSMPSSYPFTAGIVVHCEHGSIEYRFRAGGEGIEAGAPESRLSVYQDSSANTHVALETRNPYVSELDYFIRCVEENRPPRRVTAADARLALATALAINERVEQKTSPEPPARRHEGTGSTLEE